ncbi:MAG: O-antigen ligase family protein, partial [Rhodobacteraceae bacterium]|nr:O-antigen ligase family protein [Paracoccaceae bacterium]
LYPFPNRPLLWRAGLLLAALAAAQASLLSGSKGGWPVLLLIAIACAYMITRRRPLWQRHSLAAAALAALTIVALLAPGPLVRDRIASGVNGAIHWFQSGGEVTEGSVSLRFELWSLGLHIFSEHPILGTGVEGKDARWAELVATDPDYAVIGTLTSADNDVIDALSNGGIFGALSLLLAFFGTCLAFWRWRHHPDAQVMTLARMGLLLSSAYVIFGLSVSVFGISIFRALFVSLSITLLTLITNRLSDFAEPSKSASGSDRPQFASHSSRTFTP